MSRENPRSVSPGEDSCLPQCPLGYRLRIYLQTFFASRASFSNPSSTVSPDAYFRYHQHEPSLTGRSCRGDHWA